MNDLVVAVWEWWAGKVIQFQARGSAADRLEHIKYISGLPSIKQVFMNALSTYQTLKELPQGCKIIIQHPDGTKETLLVP